MKIRAIDFMWETRKDAVEEELKMLLGVEELDHSDPQCFQQCNAAAKLALERLSIEEKAEVEVALERRRAEGNPEKIQRLYANSEPEHIFPLPILIDFLQPRGETWKEDSTNLCKGMLVGYGDSE